MKSKRLIKISQETHEELKRLKRELSVLERKDISMAEIVGRTFKGEDIPKRLRLGSLERRMR